MEIFCDNESAVALAKEPRDHGRSRHIDRKYHFIRHRIEEGLLVAKRVSSDENPADPLTKGLTRVKHLQHARSIGLKDDSESVVALAKEPRDHWRSRHIDRKYHFIRHRIEEGILVAKRVSSDENLADPLTKGLSWVKNFSMLGAYG